MTRTDFLNWLGASLSCNSCNLTFIEPGEKTLFYEEYRTTYFFACAQCGVPKILEFADVVKLRFERIVNESI